jgi:hypothetical protein
MRALALFVGLAALAALAIAGCGSDVATESSTSGGNGGSGGGGGSGGAGSCSGDAPLCAYSCSSDALLPPECSGSGWVCPEGSIDIGDCPAGSCFGKPPPCHDCQMGAWTCSPSLCLDACPGVMCATCGPNSEPVQTPTCSCVCNELGQFVCKKAPDPGCCMVDFDCGDDAYMPCVNGVCKGSQPPDGSCWADGHCPAGSTCVGELVCPCGEKCDTEDTPGKCVAAP